jgi:L-threonine kinase
MKVTTFYPGGFGEIIQGTVENKDILLSFPVNIYTKVSLIECGEGSKKHLSQDYLRKSYKFMMNILKLWGYEMEFKDILIKIESKIPKGKGMASSTADLCAVYNCLIEMFNRKYDENELTEQCIAIEPTDSIIFEKMTLFDYKTGKYKESIGDYFKFNILAFEGEKVIDTIDFNNSNLNSLARIDDLIDPLRNAIKSKDLSEMSKISTESIFRNQRRLHNEFLEIVMRICEKFGGLGIIGAHSGNVLGIVFDDSEKIDFLSKSIHINKLKVYNMCALDKLKKYTCKGGDTFE